jgi:hypothetical protein
MFTAAIVMLPLVMMRLVAMQFVPMTTVIGTIVLPTNLLARDFRLNLLSVIIPSIARRDRNIWLSRCAAKVGKNGLLLNLTLAQCGEIVGYGFFLVESHLPGVSPYKTFIEDSARKLVKVFVFKGAQHARADFGDAGDSVERDTALLPLLAKFFSERSQRPAPADGVHVSVRIKMGIIIGEAWDGSQNRLRNRRYRGV